MATAAASVITRPTFTLADRVWTESEIEDLLERAVDRGFSIEKGSELEQLSLSQLERLVTTKQ